MKKMILSIGAMLAFLVTSMSKKVRTIIRPSHGYNCYNLNVWQIRTGACAVINTVLQENIVLINGISYLLYRLNKTTAFVSGKILLQ